VAAWCDESIVDVIEPVRWPRRLASVAAVVLIAAPIAALSQVGASWSPKGPMPYERAEIAIAAVNGKIRRRTRGARLRH